MEEEEHDNQNGDNGENAGSAFLDHFLCSGNAMSLSRIASDVTGRRPCCSTHLLDVAVLWLPTVGAVKFVFVRLSMVCLASWYTEVVCDGEPVGHGRNAIRRSQR